MAPDDRPRPGIPAWQRAQQPLEQKSEDDTVVAPEVKNAPDSADEADKTEDAVVTSNQEASHAATGDTVAAISTSDFDTFQQAQQQQAPATQQEQRQPQTYASGPPIITYPEYLVEAHKPPPLITLSRIWNTAYIASGIAAVAYGANQYLVKPMFDSLTYARHDFATHNLSKVEELNERLSKLVSRMPESPKDTAHSVVEDETESEASDPAELFHRNVGTQTSSHSSRENSMTTVGKWNKKTADTPADEHVAGLQRLEEHLNNLLEKSTLLETANKHRQDKFDDLLAYLDTTIYASPNISAWSATADHLGLNATVTSGAKDSDTSAKEDMVDELKKEIRAIKGLMLSAKRFPGVASRNTGAA